MWKNASTTTSVAKHTAKATIMMNDAKKKMGLDEKMQNVPKESPTNCRERRKRQKDREKDYAKKKEEREERIRALMNTWEQNRKEVESRREALTNLRSSPVNKKSNSSTSSPSKDNELASNAPRLFSSLKLFYRYARKKAKRGKKKGAIIKMWEKNSKEVDPYWKASITLRSSPVNKNSKSSNSSPSEDNEKESNAPRLLSSLTRFYRYAKRKTERGKKKGAIMNASEEDRKELESHSKASKTLRSSPLNNNSTSSNSSPSEDNANPNEWWK